MTIEAAMDVFIEAFCLGRSRTHPYMGGQECGMWVMRDGLRKDPRDYRCEEWFVRGVLTTDQDSHIRKQTRGRYAVGSIRTPDESEDELRQGYRDLRYRLLMTEMFFAHDLGAFTAADSPATISLVTDRAGMERMKRVTGRLPFHPDRLTENPRRVRQYIAEIDGEIVGWTRSIRCREGNWCSDLQVKTEHRRKGIGSALMTRMLRDDKDEWGGASCLLASHAGAKLYPRLGYAAIGQLFVYSPLDKARAV